MNRACLGINKNLHEQNLNASSIRPIKNNFVRMKKISLLFFVSILTVSLFSQAKKPVIMVFPSYQYCISRGYSMTFDNQGLSQTLPDYKKALQTDPDLRLVITKMGQIMADRGFPLKDLEQELKNLEQEGAEMSMLTSKSGAGIVESPIDKLKRTAKADILLDLDFTIKKSGPQTYISFNLKGLDAYSAKQVAGVAGAGKPSASAAPEILLEEAVLSQMDSFNAGLMRHFEDMFANGREVKMLIKLWDSSGDDLETEYDVSGESIELITAIDRWLDDNCVAGRYNRSDATASMGRYEQVRIPLMKKDGKGIDRAVDTRTFVSDLRSYLSKAPFNLTSKVYQRGLGEAWLIIGEK